MENDSNNPYTPPITPIPDAESEAARPSKLFALNGRIGRWQFLAYAGLLSMITGFVLSFPIVIVQSLTGMHDPLPQWNRVVNLSVLVPIFIMARRRFHDMNHSGWSSLTLLVPVANLIPLLYLAGGPGIDRDNRFGPSPSKNPVWVYPASLLLVARVAYIYGFR